MTEDKPSQPADNSFSSGDPRYIDIYSPAERAFWMKLLDISELELMKAIDAVGTSAQKVKDYLRRAER
jgi:hypothetical protein